MGRSSKNMSKKNSNELIKESYKKQRKRLQNAIYRAKKQGYIFPDDILPKVPKKIEEASVRRLAKIKPEDLRKKARYLIEETGELIPVKGNAKIIKEDIKRKRYEEQVANYQYKYPEINRYFPSFTENVIARFKNYILGFPQGIYEMVLPLINSIISEQGADDFAIALESMPEHFHTILHRHAFDSKGAISEFATSLIEYLPNASIQYKKDLMDRFEFNELGYTVEDEETQI